MLETSANAPAHGPSAQLWVRLQPREVPMHTDREQGSLGVSLPGWPMASEGWELQIDGSSGASPEGLQQA